MNTPGPWTHKRWDNDMGEIFAADGTCIAYVRYNGQPDDPESVAIGSLIAAAPDLLEALKAIVSADDGALLEYQAMGLGKPPAETIALTEKARAAIKKVEGDQP